MRSKGLFTPAVGITEPIRPNVIFRHDERTTCHTSQNRTFCAYCTVHPTRPQDAQSRQGMKPGGISTSGMLTLRDGQTITTDVRAQVGWAPPRPARNWTGFSALASCRKMASRHPTASRASVTRADVLTARHPRRSR